MANAEKTLKMNVSVSKLWETILKYENYAQFVDGVTRVNVISRENGKAKVEYAIELMGKGIQYVLEHDETGVPEKMTWNCVDSNFLKSNKGSWHVKSTGEASCEVTYMVDLEFKIPVPSLVLGGLIRSTLPKMLKGFEDQAKK